MTLRENSKAFKALASQQKPHGSNRHRPARVSDSDDDRLEALVIGDLGRRLSLDRCGRSREEVQLQVLVIRDGEPLFTEDCREPTPLDCLSLSELLADHVELSAHQLLAAAAAEIDVQIARSRSLTGYSTLF